MCLVWQTSRGRTIHTEQKKAAHCQELLTCGYINTCAVNNNLIQKSILVEPWGLKKYFIGSIPKSRSSNMFWQNEATQFSPSLGFTLLWDSLRLEMKSIPSPPHHPLPSPKKNVSDSNPMFQFLLKCSVFTDYLNSQLVPLGFWIQTIYTEVFLNLCSQEQLTILMRSHDYIYFMTNYCWNALSCCHMLALSLGWGDYKPLLKFKVLWSWNNAQSCKKKTKFAIDWKKNSLEHR